MDIRFTINKKFKTHNGHPVIQWHCAECHRVYDDLTSWLFQAKLANPARIDISKACQEFCEALNNYNTRLFTRERIGNKLSKRLCFCSGNVIDLEYHRRARETQNLVNIILRDNQYHW